MVNQHDVAWSPLIQTQSIPPLNGNNGKQPLIQDSTASVSPPSSGSPVPPQEPRTDQESYKLEKVQEAISEGAKLLPPNLRQIKKFINLFRFYLYIADARELFWFKEEGADKQLVGLTIDHLAIWVAWSIRWPEVAKPLSEEIQMAEYRDHLLLISRLLKEDEKGKAVVCGCPKNEAAKADPRFANLKEDELNKHRDPVYEQLTKIIAQIRKVEKSAPSHWSHLPWEWWLLDPDFRKSIKKMASFWRLPRTDEENWLQMVLTLTRTRT